MAGQIKETGIVSKRLCTGCSSCFNICPKGAIVMQKEMDGFKYPVINDELCINCGLCKKICPVLNKKKNFSLNKCYAGYSKDNQERLKASSGAIFSIIANHVLDSQGIVIGAAFNKQNKLKHIAVTNKEELDRLKGSKYLQSEIDNIFKYIKENIKNRKILFVGTPCQVAGLRAFINDNKNLITIDIICHGVPTPRLFEKYIEELEEQNNDKVVDYIFRDKKSGWKNYSNTIKFESKEITMLAKNNKYMKLFLSDIALRSSCYNCKFKLGNKYSDLTLGDFWKIERIYPEMYDSRGVSAIVINTDKGINVFNKIKSEICFRECDIKQILEYNSSLAKSAICPKKRDEFFCDLNYKDFNQIYKKYAPKEQWIKKILKKIMKREKV